VITLDALLAGIAPSNAGVPAVPLTGFTVDSRTVKPGDLFIALPGARTDGHDHIAAAAAAGAAAVLAERPASTTVPVVILPSTGQALSALAARFYGRPSQKLDVLGVTGTNGKTTITYLLESVLQSAGKSVGVIGTIDYRWPGHREAAPNTTPHAADVQRLLAAMRDAGVSHVAMEASSHALALGRVDDVEFTVGVFTNLTQDHLDFHKDMERYFEAKAVLFDRLDRSGRARRRAVINRDDPWAERLLPRVSSPVWTYGIDKESDFRATDVVLAAEGSSFRLTTPFGERRERFGLVGRHNVYNLLAALGAALGAGVPLDAAVAGLAQMHGVPGRLERVTERPAGTIGSDLPFDLFVDYAHTDDALVNVMQTLRPLTRGRLIVLFGCGGDRDRTKRPKMGEAAARLGDRVIVTSDNPRSEDPAAIAREVEAGVRRVAGRAVDVILDRREAIARAVSLAGPGDVLLLAGKGHETYQILRDRTVDFDDRAVARSLLAERARRG
jgi:UDP-N-acetylmuramoyl-L-alanyl-D-glutamate--2,6-diaminopimelate ligase